MISRILSLTAEVFTIPTGQPESDGTLGWGATTLVVATILADDRTGIGYTYTHGCAAELIHEHLSQVVLGQDCLDIPGIHQRMRASVRNFGDQGISMAAISAVDIALWDLKAKLLGLPLASLLGRCRERVPVYGSGGFTSYDELELRRQLGGWAGAGLTMVKMKVGRAVDQDPRRVAVAREAIGDGVGLFVDANGAYQPRQAVALAQEFRRQGVSWFEEPVPSREVAQLRWIRDHLADGIELAAGEYQSTLDDAQRLLDAQAVDVLQCDVTRCGGITAFLATAALCAGRRVALSSHCAPALHLALGCALEPMRHLEWFHDHVEIETRLFDGLPLPQAGMLQPDLSRPGLGLELRRSDLGRYVA